MERYSIPKNALVKLDQGERGLWEGAGENKWRRGNWLIIKSGDGFALFDNSGRVPKWNYQIENRFSSLDVAMWVAGRLPEPKVPAAPGDDDPFGFD